MLEPGFLSSFLQVIMIDLVLAGDNAVVIGLAAAGLPPELRRKAIVIGIAAATLMRIGFALIATQLLNITGLLLAGGLLLLWVCWKMFEELRVSREDGRAVESLGDSDLDADGTSAPPGRAQDAAAGGDADHHRRRLDVARQRAGGRRRGARASDGADLRAGAVDRADGPRGVADRAAAGAAPLIAWIGLSSSSTWRCTSGGLARLAAALGGLDAFVFTAGIGEHAPAIRARIADRLAWLGAELDPIANDAGATRISTRASRVALLVVPTDEELMIATHTVAVVGAGG